MPSFFFDDPNKLANTPDLLLRPLNILETVFARTKISSKIYINKNIKDIIGAIIEVRTATAKDFYKHLLKVCFLDVYRDDNYIACYNFCQQCKDNFPTIKIKKPNHIFFAVFFF